MLLLRRLINDDGENPYVGAILVAKIDSDKTNCEILMFLLFFMTCFIIMNVFDIIITVLVQNVILSCTMVEKRHTMEMLYYYAGVLLFLFNLFFFS